MDTPAERPTEVYPLVGRGHLLATSLLLVGCLGLLGWFIADLLRSGGLDHWLAGMRGSSRGSPISFVLGTLPTAVLLFGSAVAGRRLAMRMRPDALEVLSGSQLRLKLPWTDLRGWAWECQRSVKPGGNVLALLLYPNEGDPIRLPLGWCIGPQWVRTLERPLRERGLEALPPVLRRPSLREDPIGMIDVAIVAGFVLACILQAIPILAFRPGH